MVARYEKLRTERERESLDWGVTSAAFKARDDQDDMLLDQAFRLLNDGATQGPVIHRPPAPGDATIQRRSPGSAVAAASRPEPSPSRLGPACDRRHTDRHGDGREPGQI